MTLGRLGPHLHPPPAAVVLPRVIGHRGAAAVAPENTIASLRKAADLGATWVEFDVMLTRDGVPVLFHDDSLKRTTGRDAVMAEVAYAELRRLDAGSWFAPAFAGERVPTLEAALHTLLELGLHANVELKPFPGHDAQTAAAAVEVIGRVWPGDRPPPLISSYSRQCLEVAMVRAPHMPRGLIARRPPRDWHALLQAFGCSTFHAGHRWLSRRTVDRIKEAGYPVGAFTVNDPRRARLLVERGVDGIFTDAPDVIAAALA